MNKILIIYYSQHGGTARMAEHISLGVESIPQCEAIVRQLPQVSAHTQQLEAAIPESGIPFAEIEDLNGCAGLILGSPGYFGNMAAPLKYFLDQTTTLWLSGELVGKPAGVFTSTSSMHGGQESVLLSLMLPLLHHGMVVSGIPYSEPALNRTESGGTPYGASHVSGQSGLPLSEDEIAVCHRLGKRIAKLSIQLSHD